MKLRLKNLSTGYNTSLGQKVLLKSFSLETNPAEVIGILGPNGAGKSTLFRTLCGLMPALGGEVWYGDSLLAGLSLKERARIFSLVPTRGSFPNRLTVMELLCWSRHNYTDWLGRLSLVDRQVLDQVIVDCDLQEFLDRPVVQLSDGERQRVMIARALAQSVSVVFLDEPSAFLDVLHKQRLMQLVRTLSRTQKVLFLLSTHDLELALGSCDRIWLLTDGVCEQGYPEELQERGVLDRVFTPGRVTKTTKAVSICLEGESRPVKNACQRLGITLDIQSKTRIIAHGNSFTIHGADTEKKDGNLCEVLSYLDSLTR